MIARLGILVLVILVLLFIFWLNSNPVSNKTSVTEINREEELDVQTRESMDVCFVEQTATFEVSHLIIPD